MAEITTAPLPNGPLLGHVSPGMAEILSPREDSVIGRRTVRVRVRVATGVRSFRATLDSRRITKLFSPPRGGIRTAVISVGKRLRLGRNHLTVETHNGGRADYDAANFQVARRDTGFVTLDARVSDSPNEHVAARVRLGAPADGFTAVLNGRKVDRRLLLKGKRLRRGRLDVDDGMRDGANTLIVRAFRGGRFDREAFDFNVAPQRALIGAGKPKTGMAGLPVKLDATASTPSNGERALQYRWRLVSAPPGSKVPLRRSGTVRPSFTPPTNGRYTFKLTAGETDAAVSQAVTSAARAQPAGSDTVTVAVQPDAPPIGLPIETIPKGSGGPTLGGQPLIAGPGLGPIQMAVLERDTLAVNQRLTQTFSPFSVVELDAFQAALSQVREPSETDAGELLILTGANQNVGPLDTVWVAALKSAYQQFGGSLVPFPGAAAGGGDPGFGTGQWSLIGVPGTDAGQAAQQQFEAPPGQQAGSLSGYLQQTATSVTNPAGGYAFVFGNYLPFNTNVPDQPANRVTVSIGSESSFVNETFTSDPLGPGESGFYILALDQGTLQELTSCTEATNDASGNQIDSGVYDLTGCLGNLLATRPTALVIVQAIGTPSARDQSWQGLNGIQYLGGSLDVFNYPADAIGLGGYTLMGGTNLMPNSGVEENTAVTREWGQPARLTGVLRQNRQSQWVADNSDPTGSHNPQQYLGIISQPAQAWPVPAPDNSGEQAAMAYIAANIDAGAPLVDQTDVRPNYWLEGLGFKWDTSLLTDITPPPANSPAAAGFGAVIDQLKIEFPIVKSLNSYYSTLQTNVLAGQALAGPNLQSIASNIATDVQVPQTMTDFQEFLDIFGQVTSVAGTFFPVGGQALAAVSGAAQIMGDLDYGASGNNTLSQRVMTDATDLQEQSADASVSVFQNLEQAYGLLVSDWGRLQAAGQLVNKVWLPKVPDYVTAFIKSYQQYFYTAMTGVAYNVFAVQGTSFPGNECVVFGGVLGPIAAGLVNPGGGTPGGWDFFVDYGQENNLTSKVLTTAFQDDLGIQPGNAPGDNVIGPMFQPYHKTNGVLDWTGMYPQYFYGRNYPFAPSVVCSGA